LLAALAAEVLTRRDRIDEARARLVATSAEQPFGHVIGWAAAGVDLAAGDPAAAARALAALDRRCRTLGYLTGRELVLARQVDAELAAGETAAAAATGDRLAEVARRVGTPQARLHWLVAETAVRPTDRILRTALELAEQCGDVFQAARIRLTAATATADAPEADEWLRAAHASFRELGAARWQRRTAELLRARGRSSRNTQTIGEQDRKLIDLIASGHTNAEAAAELQVTEKAVEARLTRLYRRTGLRSRVALVREYGPES
jgi:DNA-binding NarL/FixJ family response regulator